jgi:hypothetical protein
MKYSIQNETLVQLSPTTLFGVVHVVRRVYKGNNVHMYCGLVRKIKQLKIVENKTLDCGGCERVIGG